jgi:hypothetical protein
VTTRTRKRLFWLAAAVLLLAYVTSYVVITQHRYEQFRGYHACGFWYVSWEDETSESWERKERLAWICYRPLHFVENDVLGLGMPHAACSPFFRLGK